MVMKLSRHVQADPRRTFAAFTDFAGAPQHVSGIKRIELLTEGPVRVGTRFRETRVMFNREATEEMEVTEFRPSESYSLGCDSCGARWSSRFVFTPEGGGTRVDLEMQCRPTTFVAWLMTPMSWLMAGTMRKCVEQDMIDMQRVAEGNAAGAPVMS